MHSSKILIMLVLLSCFCSGPSAFALCPDRIQVRFSIDQVTPTFSNDPSFKLLSGTISTTTLILARELSDPTSDCVFSSRTLPIGKSYSGEWKFVDPSTSSGDRLPDELIEITGYTSSQKMFRLESKIPNGSFIKREGEGNWNALVYDDDVSADTAIGSGQITVF